MADDFHLPDDVESWPRDPWAVLGVEPDAEISEIRSAYAALIRRFKPEHHPLQFGRIRDAFDRARRSRGQITGPSHDDPLEPTSPLEPSAAELKMAAMLEVEDETGGKGGYWKTVTDIIVSLENDDLEVKISTSLKEHVGKLLPESPAVAADDETFLDDPMEEGDDRQYRVDAAHDGNQWPAGPRLLELIDAESVDVPEFEYVKFGRRLRRVGGSRSSDADTVTPTVATDDVPSIASEIEPPSEKPAIEIVVASSDILEESTDVIEATEPPSQLQEETTTPPSPAGENGDDDSQAEPSDKTSASKGKDEKRPYSGRPRRRPLSVEDRSEAAWVQAARGYPRAAYRDHLELLGESPSKGLIYARLYWLVAIFPDIDSSLHRCDWLIRGLDATDASRNLLDLVLREMDGDATEAADPRWLAALDLDLPDEKMLTLINCRWRGCSRTENWPQIVEDFERFRVRFEYENRETWLRIMLIALDYLVWVDDDEGRELADAIRTELEESCSDFFELENDLVRSDMLCELEEACARLDISVTFRSPRVVGLRRLVRDSWNEPTEQLCGEWIDFFIPLVEDPLTGLGDLSRIERFRPFLMHFVNEQVSQIHSARFGYDTMTVPHSLIDSLLEMCDDRERTWSRYSELRNDVFRFCLEHEITLSQFLRELPTNTKDRLEHYGALEELQADRSLSCLLMGYRLVYCG